MLGETEDALYFVSPHETTPAKLRDDITLYAEGPDEEGGKGQRHTVFDNYESIRPYGSADRRRPSVPDPERMPPEGEIVVDIVAWPSETSEDARDRASDIKAACDGCPILGQDFDKRTTVVRARVGRDALGKVLELTAVESVRLPIGPEIEPSEWLNFDFGDVAPDDPLDIVIGIIDDGVVNHPLLDGLIVDQDTFPEDHHFSSIGTHGTEVAGLAAYGGFDTLFSDSSLPSPMYIAVAQVLQQENLAGVTRLALPSDVPDHLVLRAAAEWLVNTCGARVICMSISESDAFAGPYVGPVTETLDRLSHELNVVFVVCTGNTAIRSSGETDSGQHVYGDYPSYLFHPRHRIAEPAVAATVLTVGSLSTSDTPASPDGRSSVDDHVVAGRDEVSPFSRSGPGLRDAVKPELVAGGGGVVWSSGLVKMTDFGTSILSLNSRLDQQGFRVAAGTSYSAARIANIVGRVAAAYPDASANLLRSLVALSANVPASGQFNDQEQRTRTLGYGKPSWERASESNRERVVLICDDRVFQNGANIHPIPIPDDFSGAGTRRRFRIAIAFDPPVRRERRDYLGGHLQLELYRATSIDEVESIHQEQVDSDSVVRLPSDRRRFFGKFVPTRTRLLTSTLQVYTFDLKSSRSLRSDDGDTYFLVVTHISSSWLTVSSADDDAQTYAVAVELEDTEDAEIDLYSAVRQQLERRERERIRL